MPAICLVVPCFNEAKRLRGTDLVAFLDVHQEVDVCLVDDGSRDRTWDVLQALARQRPGRISAYRLEVNSGKAEAVRRGVLHVADRQSLEAIGYWDADFSTPLAEVEGLAKVLRDMPGCQLVLGARVKRLGARIERKASRHVLGRIFASLASGTLGLDIYDSQCGAKLIRAEWVGRLFSEPFLTRWLFDLELLLRLRNLAPWSIDLVQEVPLTEWREVRGSKLTLRDMVGVPLELLRLRRHYNTHRG